MGKTIKQLKEYATKKFIQHKIESHWIDISIILSYVANLSTTGLIIYDSKELDDELVEKFYKYIDMRLEEMPVAYIVGYKYFMGYKFWVNSNVLIPRSDTELLVEKAIETIKTIKKEKINVVDMCTGSGCIGISILKYFKDHDITIYNKINLTCVDISKEALNVAIKNATSQMVQSKVEFIESNLFEKFPNRKIDVAISNPPYIKSDVINKLDESVKKEPIIALDGMKDGLFFYKRISEDIKKYLNESSYLMYEIGYDQGKEVSDILHDEKYVEIHVYKDLSDNDRVVICKNG